VIGSKWYFEPSKGSPAAGEPHGRDMGQTGGQVLHRIAVGFPCVHCGTYGPLLQRCPCQDRSNDG
jgi:hypothetical protein